MNEWEDLIPGIAETFGGQLPYPETANDIRNAYQRAPETVLRLADQVAAAYQDGTARNPWGMLRYRCSNIQETEKKAQTRNNREKAVERAEQWIRNAGMHCDREHDVLDELFGDQGMLRHHHTDDLERRMLALWNELRPVGEQIEADHHAFMARYAEQRKRVDLTPKPKTGNLTTDQLKALALTKSQPVTHVIADDDIDFTEEAA